MNLFASFRISKPYTTVVLSLGSTLGCCHYWLHNRLQALLASKPSFSLTYLSPMHLVAISYLFVLHQVIFQLHPYLLSILPLMQPVKKLQRRWRHHGSTTLEIHSTVDSLSSLTPQSSFDWLSSIHRLTPSHLNGVVLLIKMFY